jgi:hypothetical protein
MGNVKWQMASAGGSRVAGSAGLAISHLPFAMAHLTFLLAAPKGRPYGFFCAPAMISVFRSEPIELPK